MGKRVVLISLSLVIEFLKARGGVSRSFTIEHPLPDDARAVEGYVLPVVLESQQWAGDVLGEVRSPEITVHYPSDKGVNADA